MCGCGVVVNKRLFHDLDCQATGSVFSFPWPCDQNTNKVIYPNADKPNNRVNTSRPSDIWFVERGGKLPTPIMLLNRWAQGIVLNYGLRISFLCCFGVIALYLGGSVWGGEWPLEKKCGLVLGQ
jgi:hypothetical protein